METSGWGARPDRTEGPGGHSFGVGDESTESEGDVVDGVTVYKHVSTIGNMP